MPRRQATRLDSIIPIVIEQMRQSAKSRGRAFRLRRPPQPRGIIPLQRAYLADLNGFVSALKHATDEMIIANLENFKAEATGSGIRARKSDDFVDTIVRAVNAARLLVLRQYSEDEIRRIAKKQADRVNTANARDIDRIFGAVLNLKLTRAEPYLVSAMKGFVTNNVSLITSIPDTHFKRVEQTVLRGIQAGKPNSVIKEEIKKSYKVSESRAALIARDQTAKFNGDLNELRQTEVGVTKYIWSTSGDERVRDSHAEKDGEVFSWDDPPSDTGHPGEDFQCRCVAIPVFDDI